tara:strand:+ start:1653 stop:1940 length:288 start_codon:yes stop_codon:yes gene_type:complete
MESNKKISPEKKLWQSVLNLAVEDALMDKTKFKQPISVFNKRLCVEINHARSWFKNFSSHFFFVCSVSDCNPQSIHEKMIKKIKILEEKEKYLNV